MSDPGPYADPIAAAAEIAWIFVPRGGTAGGPAPFGVRAMPRIPVKVDRMRDFAAKLKPGSPLPHPWLDWPAFAARVEKITLSIAGDPVEVKPRILPGASDIWRRLFVTDRELWAERAQDPGDRAANDGGEPMLVENLYHGALSRKLELGAAEIAASGLEDHRRRSAGRAGPVLANEILVEPPMGWAMHPHVEPFSRVFLTAHASYAERMESRELALQLAKEGREMVKGRPFDRALLRSLIGARSLQGKVPPTVEVTTTRMYLALSKANRWSAIGRAYLGQLAALGIAPPEPGHACHHEPEVPAYSPDFLRVSSVAMFYDLSSALTGIAKITMRDDPAATPMEVANMMVGTAAIPGGTPRDPAREGDQKEFHRRLVTLASHPFLMQGLGLVFEGTVTGPAAGTSVAVSVDAIHLRDVAAPLRPRIVIPTEVSLAAGEAGYFFAQPAPRQDPLVAELHRRGTLNLRRTSGSKRYFLTQVDMDGGVHRMTQAAVRHAHQNQAFVDPGERDKVSAGAPRTVGLALLMGDPLAAQQLPAPQTAIAHLEGERVKVAARYAEELTLGYRVDVRRENEPWRSLHVRRLHSFELGGRDLADALGRPVDEGIVQHAIRDVPAQNGEPSGASLVQENIFTWMNWSLSVPPADSAGASPRDPQADPVGIRYSLEGKLPAQRFGSAYRVGMRVVYADGFSLDVPSAAQAYEQASTWLGDGTQPFSFRRHETALPPDVLLAAPLDRRTLRAQQIDRVVLASAASRSRSQHASSRFLIAPRVSLELAILHGMFDNRADRERRRSGAFRGVHLNADGSFPAVGSRRDAVAAGGMDPPSPTAPVNEAAEPIFLYQPLLALAPRHPYYPDPWAERIACMLVRASDGLVLGIETVDVYPDGAATWPDVEPLRIDVEAASAGTVRLRKTERPCGRYSDRKVPALVVELPVGDEVRLLVWSDLNPARYAAEAALPPQIVKAASIAGSDSQGLMRSRGVLGMSAERMVGELFGWSDLSARPLNADAVGTQPKMKSTWTVNPYRAVTMLHAAERPQLAPRFMDEAELGVAAVYQRAAGDTEAVFTGAIAFDRRTTGRIDCYACWSEWIDDPAMPKPERAERRTPLKVKLDDIAYLSPEEAAQLQEQPQTRNRLNLGPATPEGQAFRHEFNDTRYREVRYTLVGTSRHASEFSSTDRTRYTLAGPTKALAMRSSTRPPAPKVDAVVPLFDWDEAVGVAEHRRTRDGSWFRVWLSRPWYASGDGEKLALLFWPDASPTTPPAVCLERLLTRWGADPLWSGSAPRLTPFLTAAALRNAVGFARNVKVPLGVESPTMPASGAYTASAALFDPAYDVTSRRWYVDIKIDAPEAYFPFLRLGLARYQEHSLDGLELSHIDATEFIQLTATRSATLRYRRTDLRAGEVSITVRGPAHDKVRRPGQQDPGLRKTVMRATLERRYMQGHASGISAKRLDPAEDADRLPVESGWIPVTEDGKELSIELRFHDGAWSGSLPVPSDVSLDGLSLFIEEAEHIEAGSDTEIATLAIPRIVYMDRIALLIEFFA